MQKLTQEQFSELLKTGCMKFKEISLNDVDLSSYDLSNIIFKNCTLWNINFNNANMTNTDFFDCVLGNITLGNAYALKDNIKFKYRFLKGV